MTSEVPCQPVAIRPIVLLSIAAFGSAATLRVTDPLLPLLAEEFRTDVADASIVATGFTLGYGLFQVLYGPLGDRFGKFFIVIVATFLSGFGTAAAAIATDLSIIGVARFISGSTAGAIIPMAMAYIGDTVPYEQRQRVISRFLLGQILGITAGQTFGGAAADFIGWRGVFLALGALSAIVAALMCLERKSVPAVQTMERLDLKSAVLAYTRLLCAPNVRLILGVVFMEGVLFYGGFAYFGAFLREVEGLEFGTVGAILAGFGVGALLYVAFARKAVLWLRQKGLVMMGGIQLFVGMIMLTTQLPSYTFAVPLILCGSGYYMLHTTLQTLATQMAPTARGVAISAFAASLFLGQTAGVGLGGHIVTRVGYDALFLSSGFGLLLLAILARTHLTSN